MIFNRSRAAAAAAAVALAGAAPQPACAAMVDPPFPAAACAATSAAAAGTAPMARPKAAFLGTIGVNIHVSQGYPEAAYAAPLRYLGVGLVRDGAAHIGAEVLLHRQTGVRFDLFGDGDLADLSSGARTLAAAGALYALEGPNEPNNFPITYQGRRGGGLGDWLPVADEQRDLYAAAKTDPRLASYPVFGVSEAGAETENTGLQYLTIPPGANTMLPADTRFADAVNLHNYVDRWHGRMIDNQAWQDANQLGDGPFDGLYGNAAVTWRAHFLGYPAAKLGGLPWVTTETGWDSASDFGGAAMQARILVDIYLDQFMAGARATFIYELEDSEGGSGHQGLFEGATPKPAARAIHNLTTALRQPAAAPAGGIFGFALAPMPPTAHALLLRGPDGGGDLVLWSERLAGPDRVTLQLSRAAGLMITDVLAGTTAATASPPARCYEVTLAASPLVLTAR